MNAQIIIMDEPTTSLTDPEIEHVFEILRTLKKQNVGIVFISHKLREVMEICDRYTVLRDGVMVSEGYVRDVTTDLLARDMVGHDVRNEPLNRSVKLGDEVLRLEDLTQEPHYRHISLSVRAGEVLGVTGLLGDGRSEIFRTVFGDTGKYQGNIIVNGKSVQMHSTQQALALGIGYVPRNRKENGIIKDMNILENGSIVTWPRLARRGLIDRKAQRENLTASAGAAHQDGKARGPHHKPVRRQPAEGGAGQVAQRQSVAADSGQPHAGRGRGAKEEIYDIILRLADQGVAVVVLSNEAQEIIRVCDRALVLYHGDIQAEVKGETMNEHEMMRLATGG